MKERGAAEQSATSTVAYFLAPFEDDFRDGSLAYAVHSVMPFGVDNLRRLLHE